MSTTGDTVGATLVGVATGLRSTVGMAAIVLAGPPAAHPGLLGTTRAKVVAATLLAGELVADKLPAAPPRTDLSGLVPRLVLGGVGAGLLGAGRPIRSRARLAATGSLGALGGAFGGLTARASAANAWSPLPAALVEDLVAVALAAAATRLAPASEQVSEPVAVSRPGEVGRGERGGARPPGGADGGQARTGPH